MERRSSKRCRRPSWSPFRHDAMPTPRSVRSREAGSCQSLPDGRARYCLLSAGGTVTPYNQTIGQLLQGDWCDPSSAIGGISGGGNLAGGPHAVGHRQRSVPGLPRDGPGREHAVSSKPRSTSSAQASEALRSVVRRSPAGLGAPLKSPTSCAKPLEITAVSAWRCTTATPVSAEELIGRVGAASSQDALTRMTKSRCRSTARGERSCAARRPRVGCPPTCRACWCFSAGRSSASCSSCWCWC